MQHGNDFLQLMMNAHKERLGAEETNDKPSGTAREEKGGKIIVKDACLLSLTQFLIEKAIYNLRLKNLVINTINFWIDMIAVLYVNFTNCCKLCF